MWRGIVGLLGLFAGLCTIFALFVTAGEGWQEHVQAQWPVATARVERCGVDPSSTRRTQRYYIACRLSYVVGSEEIVAKVYSGSVGSRAMPQYTSSQVGIGDLQEWVDEHPQGTPITVHYDPGNHKKAVLVETDMPRGGPHTPNNLKLLGVAAISCIALLAIARIGSGTQTS